MTKKKSQEKSQEIGRVDEVIDAALRLFLERGYDNAPMSLLAKRLRLTKAGIYHHFASKEDLLFIVHKTAMERQLTPVFDAVAKESDPERQLRLFLYDYALMLAHEPTAALMIREARRLSPQHLQEIKKTWRRGFDLVRQSIARLQRAGRCRADVNPTFAAFAAIGMASWISYWFDPKRPQSAEAVAQTIVDIFMSGLTAAGVGRSSAGRTKIAAAAARRPRTAAKAKQSLKQRRRA